MARWDHRKPPFDWQRHLKQGVGQVLPLLVLVAAAGWILWLAFDPGVGLAPGSGRPDPEPLTRVGLLPAVGAGAGAGTGPPAFDPAFVLPRPLELAMAPLAARFDEPLGSPLGALTYNAQPFLVSRHLGDDLNGIGGRHSDLGDAVRAAGDGTVVFSGPAGEGWGNVVMVLHRLGDGTAMITQYGHLDRLRLPVGATVRRGEKVGTVGDAGGRYLAHLHFEVRPAGSLDPGPGYADSDQGRLPGLTFLAARRGAPDDRQNPPLGGAWDTRLPGSAESDSASGTRLRVLPVPPPPGP